MNRQIGMRQRNAAAKMEESVDAGYLAGARSVWFRYPQTRAHPPTRLHRHNRVNWSGDVGLLPMFSGYRDSDTRSLHLTNNYTKGNDLEEREVVVMQSEIASIRHFDLDAYHAVESGKAELPTIDQERPL